MRTTHTIALALASLACIGKGRGMRKRIQQMHGNSHTEQRSSQTLFALVKSQAFASWSPSRTLTMLVFALNPAAGWLISGSGHRQDLRVNQRPSCRGKGSRHRQSGCLPESRRQVEQGVSMSVVDDTSESKATSDATEGQRSNAVAFFQEVAIPSILQEEPDWDVFAEDLIVIDRSGAKVEGLRPVKLLLKMIRRMWKQYVEDWKVELIENASGVSADSANAFTVRWKIQLGSENVGDQEVPVDLEVETVCQQNKESKVDFIQIDKWLVNGNQWIQSSPVSSIGSLMRETLQRKLEVSIDMDPASKFLVEAGYNYSISTEENYAVEDDAMIFVGEYTAIREKLDYTYHRVYQQKRQLLQDQIIKDFLNAEVSDSNTDLTCSAPMDPWIVFTAGAMGAGKSHAISWLHSQDHFPLEAFVTSDPDQIRAMLPETLTYNLKDSESCGFHTQKEANYISEILTETALQQGQNIIVDGSLRDYEWYDQYFKKLRRRYPGLKIGIIHVHASPDVVLKRAAARAKVTGRAVPSTVIYESIEQLPKSLEVLVPQADFFAKVRNEGQTPELIEPDGMSWEEFEDNWAQECPIIW